MKRTSGILLHITSLPSKYGIGTLGSEAKNFVDFLAESGQKYWQILPLGHTDYGNSPYYTLSAFAGNPNLIDLEELIKDGLISSFDADNENWGREPSRVDFGCIYYAKRNVLRKAFKNGWDRYLGEIIEFQNDNAEWLRDYSTFMALKDHFEGKPWGQWPDKIKLCHAQGNVREAVDEYMSEIEDDIHFYVFCQFLFYKQWRSLKEYANSKNIEFIGDVPIYVPMDSADVWSNPENFQLTEDMQPKVVAGCPPDGFTEDGQLWGNPIYDWDKMKEDRYSWWQKRMMFASTLFDVIRFDHFRGLSSYWSIPFGETTAKNGKWVEGPGKELIAVLNDKCSDTKFIAEDLGYLTEDVYELLKFSGYPGMKILEFAYDNRMPNDYRPHVYEKNCICYAGTHDNMTIKQWLESLSQENLQYVKDYMALNKEEGYVYGVIRTGMSSVADLFISQMQDWLELGEDARMNTPGSMGNENWSWRALPGSFSAELKEKIKFYTELYERLP